MFNCDFETSLTQVNSISASSSPGFYITTCRNGQIMRTTMSPISETSTQFKRILLLNEVKAVVTRLYRQRSDYAPMGLGGVVIILCKTLQHAANEIYRDLLAHRESFWYRNVWPSRRMLATGWCLNRVSILQQLFTTSAMYFVSSLEGVDAALGKHARCTKDRCLVHRDTYRSIILCDGSRCDFTCLLQGPGSNRRSLAGRQLP